MSKRFWRRLVHCVRRDAFERELDEEMRLHLEMKTSERLEAGLSPENARRQAQREFGNTTLLRETTREIWTFRSLQTIVQDLRYGLRMMRRSPGFTAVAVLSLGLGIGANTAIFSLVDVVLLRPLPVEKPAELVLLKRSELEGLTDGFSFPKFGAIRDRQDVFSGVFAWGNADFQATSGGEAHRIQGTYTTAGYHATLGVAPALGRLLLDEDDRPNAPPVAVLSYGYWQREFGGSRDVLGRLLTLDGLPVTIVGVTQPGFFGIQVGRSPDVTVSFSVVAATAPFPILKLDGMNTWRIVARCKPGVSSEQARARLQVLWPQIVAALAPGEPPRLEPRILLESAARGFSLLRVPYASSLGVLMGIVALVLLVACTNVANLLLARAVARQREIAVRLAIGAGRRRILRQLLTESLLLSTLGAAVGLPVAYYGTRFLVDLISTERTPVRLELGPDSRVLAFTAALAVATAMLFGLAPALRAARLGWTAFLSGAPRALGPARSDLGRPLVVSQVAFSIVLLVGAGLFLRTLANLRTFDAGFRREGLILARVSPGQNPPGGPRSAELYRRIVERVRGLPGVRSATLSTYTPLERSSWTDPITMAGRAPSPETERIVHINKVGPGYFETLGTPLLAGRGFTERDVTGAPKVAVVNQALVRRLLEGANPLGRRVRLPNASFGELEIVGVVGDARHRSLREPAPPTLYLSYFQNPFGPSGASLAVHTDADPTLLIEPLRRAARELHPGLSLAPRTVASQVEETLLQERLVGLVSALFGGLALAVAAAGLYGVTAYRVTRRTAEIGLRMALGAEPTRVLRSVLGETLRLTGLGIVLGVALSVAGARSVQALLFGVPPVDPIVIGATGALMLLAAALAAYVPARRAARLDPMEALRHE